MKMNFKSKLGLSLASLALGASLGCAPIYPSLSERQAVRRYSTEWVIPNYVLGVDGDCSKLLKGVMDILENVPDCVQERANELGYKVLIVRWPKKDSDSRDKIRPWNWPRGTTWNDLPGWYSPGKKAVVIRLPYSRYDHGSISLELHEYGHMINDAFDFPAFEQPFLDVFETSKKKKEHVFFRRIMDHEAKKADEFFAECFAKYYFSDRPRHDLREHFPEACEYFRQFEINCLVRN